MRRWLSALVVVTVAACGTDGAAPAGPAAGDPTAAFPDPDDLPLISTTTTTPPADGLSPAGGADGATATPTTFRGVPPRPPRTTTTTAAGPGAGTGGEVPFTASARLSGAEVVPPPGDPRGTGTAHVRRVANGLCVDLEVGSLVAEPTAAHLHRGGRGTIGEVVAVLRPPPSGGTASTCVDMDRAAVDAITADPSHHYVDVHSGTHPDGAIRGQLAAA